MKKNVGKTILVASILLGSAITANAHSLYRTFNIKAFSSPTTVTYNKTDGSTSIGVALSQAGVEEKRDVISFTFSKNGSTIFSTNVVEGDSDIRTYSNNGSAVSVTFKDKDYNLGSHTVKGTLYW